MTGRTNPNLDDDLRSSVLSLVVFIIEGQRYGLRLQTVERVLPIVAVSFLPKAPAVVLGVVNFHGRIVPVLDARRRFGFPPREFRVSARLLVSRTDKRIVALCADEVFGVQELPAASVFPPETVLPGIDHVAGIAALADGLLFIHDLDAFLSLDEERQLAEGLEVRHA